VTGGNGSRNGNESESESGGGGGTNDPRGADGPGLLLDAMLGTLATYLRICGFDAAYALDRGVEADDALAALARREGRTLITRDRALARRVEGSLLLEARDVEAQVAQLRAAGIDVRLDPDADPSRCGRCNGRLVRADDDPRPDYAPDGGPIWRCRDCDRRFWTGSHWDDVRERLRRAGSDGGDAGGDRTGVGSDCDGGAGTGG